MDKVKIEELFEEVKGKDIIIWGTGGAYEDFINKFTVDIKFLVDNDSCKWGKIINGIEVKCPKELLNFNKMNSIIIICSMHYTEIKEQLFNYGYLERQIINGLNMEFFLLKHKGVFKKNQLLKNKHVGERCFILGTGPSINHQNLELIKDNDVKIGVNSFYKHSLIKNIAPQYWVVADPEYWKNPKNLLNPLAERMQGVGLNFFIPTPAFYIEDNYPMFKDMSPYYYYLDITQDEKEVDIDFSGKLPHFAQNVISPSIMLAIYLGCTSIYLIGCDHSWWSWDEDMYEEEIKKHTHFYKKSNEERKINISSWNMYDFKTLQQSIARQVYEYKSLKTYADKKGVKIYNATEGGNLEIFPRVKFHSLF